MSRFKVGEIVRCKPGFNNIQNSGNYGGAGYIEGVSLTIRRVSEFGHRVYFFENYENGVYEEVLITVDKYRNDKLEKLLK